jgi:hypothetical protein
MLRSEACVLQVQPAFRFEHGCGTKFFAGFAFHFEVPGKTVKFSAFQPLNVHNILSASHLRKLKGFFAGFRLIHWSGKPVTSVTPKAFGVDSQGLSPQHLPLQTRNKPVTLTITLAWSWH